VEERLFRAAKEVFKIFGFSRGVFLWRFALGCAPAFGGAENRLLLLDAAINGR
jgi:hypothetical protein